MDRFRAYLQTMVDPETKDIQLPLSPMNPMGKDHVPALLDEYLAFDADGVAARAVAEAELVSRTRPAPSKWRWSSPMT